MRILFTTSDSWVSKAITYLTREPISHVAIQMGEFIIHSSLTGVRVTHMSTFYRKRRLRGYVPADRFMLHSLGKVLEDTEGRSYDYTGLLYLGLRYYAKRYLGVSLPKVNLWQISGMFTCTEFVTKVLSGKEDSLITPYQLFLLLGGNPNEIPKDRP